MAPAPSSPPPSATPASTAAPHPPPPLSIFAEGWNLTVTETHGPVVIHDAFLGAMATVEGARVTRVEAPFQRLPTGPGIIGSLTGGWPEGALLVMGRSNGWMLQPFRRTHDSWEPQALAGDDYKYGYQIKGRDGGGLSLIAAAAPAGRSIALVHPFKAPVRLLSLGGDGKPNVLGTVSVQTDGDLVALPGGDVAVLGRYAGAGGGGRWAVERWRPGKEEHAIVAFLDVSDRQPMIKSFKLCRTQDDAVHIVLKQPGSPRYDFLALRGAHWDVDVKEIPAIKNVGVEACAVGQDGSMWLVLGPAPGSKDATPALYRRTPAGSIERVPYPPLPPRTRRPRVTSIGEEWRRIRYVVEDIPVAEQVPGTFHGDDVNIADDGTVWVAGARWEHGAPVVSEDVYAVLGLARRVVLRIGSPLPGTPIDWETFAPGILESRVAAYNAQGGPSFENAFDDGPPRPSCDTFFVRLSTFPKTGPTPDDFPAVRAIVKGRADLAGTHFVEARIGNEHVLGALSPSLKGGRWLLALLKGRIPSAGARVHCGTPHVVRAIPMGLADE